MSCHLQRAMLSVSVVQFRSVSSSLPTGKTTSGGASLIFGDSETFSARRALKGEKSVRNQGKLHDSIFSLSDTGHALLATIVFSFFAVYVMHDMVRFRDETKVLLAGLASIAISAYWWIGFMAKYGIPAQPIIPAQLNPPQWAYLVMAACLAAWTFWDILDAMKDEFDDKRFVFTAGTMLIVGITISLFMTLRIPAIQT
jgi:hypothetical protein